MTIHLITNEMLPPSRHESDLHHYSTPTAIRDRTILQIGGYKFGLMYVSEAGSCRRVFEGPILPGPYAAVFGLASVISAHRSPHTDTVINVAVGDVLVMPDGTHFAVLAQRYDSHNFKLEVMA